MADVIVEAEPTAPVPEIIEPAVPVEATEAVAEAAVEVAQIEADKEVAIAEIQAETQQQAIETTSEVIAEDNEEWRRNIEARQATLEEQNREILSILQELRQPPPNLLESQESLEVTQESQEAPEPAPPKKRPHHKLI